VSVDKILEGEVVAIRCAHGDTFLYPLAMVHLQINGYNIGVKAALSDTLPMPVLLGTNVPQLQELIVQALCKDNQHEATRDVLVDDEVLDKLDETALIAFDAGDSEVANVEDSGAPCT